MFKPLHQDHAIESVIFRLTGSGEMTEHERGSLDEGYQKHWKTVLPKVNQSQLMEIAMGPTPLVDDMYEVLQRGGASCRTARPDCHEHLADTAFRLAPASLRRAARTSSASA